MNPVVARVVAVLAATAMVVGALALRDQLDGGDGGPDVTVSPGGRPTADPGGDDGAERVVCADDLRAVCEALIDGVDGVSLVFEGAGVTAERLAGSERPDLDAWIVLAPWPAVVDDARQRGGRDPLFTDATTTLASTPLVLVVAADRAAVLDQRCGTITWACVGEVAGGSWAAAGGEPAWGAPKPGHAAPTTAAGLLVTGQAAASRLDTTAFSARDLAADAFRGWFTTLERAVTTFTPSSGSHLRQLLQFGPSTVDVVGTTEAEAAALLPLVGDRAANVRVVHAAPLLVADLVVAELDGGLADRLAGRVEILAGAGWRTGDAPPSTFGDWPVLPTPRVPLPSAGSLEALQSTWREVVR